MVWYSRLFRNFPQFVVIHTVKGFVIVNETEVDVFLELSCFVNDPTDVYISMFNTALTTWQIYMFCLLLYNLMVAKEIFIT